MVRIAGGEVEVSLLSDIYVGQLWPFLFGLVGVFFCHTNLGNYGSVQKIKSWNLADCTQNLIPTSKGYIYMCVCVCIYVGTVASFIF